MIHDPLCPDRVLKNWATCWTCDVIASVRADERDSAARRVKAVEGGYSVPPEMPVGSFIDAMRREMVAAAAGTSGTNAESGDA